MLKIITVDELSSFLKMMLKDVTLVEVYALACAAMNVTIWIHLYKL